MHSTIVTLTLKLQPQLNIAALNKEEDRQYILWRCLKSIDSQGRAVLPMDDTIRILTESYGYTTKTADKHLRLGNGVYWNIRTTRTGETIIILSSLEKVVIHLEVNLDPKARWVPVPVKDFPGSGELQARRALLFCTGVYKPLLRDVKKIRPLDQTTIEEKFGINERTQRRYNAKLQTVLPGTMGCSRVIPYERDPETGKLRHHTRIVFKGPFDRPVEVHQLPNRYWTNHPYGSCGMLYGIARRLHKAKNQSLITGTNIPEKVEKANVKVKCKQRYYTSYQSYQDANRGGILSDIECYYSHRDVTSRMILGDVS